ncbi:MAG: hypothetical protein S4CHLAM20_04300 [Chlamydiia bacterium]|nr:hypothetical protein [Chlamydiia bacterium]
MSGVISKVISVEFDKLKRHVIKVLSKGKIDVRTPLNTSPPNTDAPPIAGLRAIYMRTGNSGKSVIIGYINEKMVAKPGEYRIYSTDLGGVEKNYIHLTNDGVIEIGGESDNMVRYSKLNDGMSDLDTQINAELVKIATAIGGSYTPGTISTDISDSKIDEVKTS